MRRKSGVAALGVLLGLVSGQAMAQDDVFEVTLEVLDDVTDVDGVVLILEEQDRRERAARSEDEQDERRAVERDAREQDEGLERGTAERDFEGERDERREERVEDRDLERDRDDTIIEEESDIVEPPVDEPVVDEPLVDERELAGTDAIGDV